MCGKLLTNTNLHHHYLILLQALLLLRAMLTFSRTKYPNFMPLSPNTSTSSSHSPSPPTEPSNFYSFRPASESKIAKILIKCPNKQSNSDPMTIPICHYTYHHQHCQSVSHLRSVPSYSQRICHLPISQETYSRQRSTLKLPSNLQSFPHIPQSFPLSLMSVTRLFNAYSRHSLEL